MDSIKDIAAALRKAENCVIFPHINMDGDALGSAAALCLAMRSLGIQSYVLLSEKIPDNLDFLENGCCIEETILPECVDTAVMLDCNGYNRIKGREDAFSSAKTKVCIDHHSVGASDIEYDYFHCEPDSAATGEIVYMLIKELGCEISLAIADAIFSAVTTDTGNFQHSNTTKRTHAIAASLYDVPGFESKRISTLIYDRRTREEFKLENIVLSNLDYYADGKIAVGSVTQDLLSNLGCDLSHADPIIQRVMSIKGVEVGVIVKENPEGIFKASMRAKSYANVAEVAAMFGGGGHVRAAGCTLGKDIGEIKFRLIEELGKAVNR